MCFSVDGIHGQKLVLPQAHFDDCGIEQENVFEDGFPFSNCNANQENNLRRAVSAATALEHKTTTASVWVTALEAKKLTPVRLVRTAEENNKLSPVRLPGW